jgi:hypothetical protein
MAEGLPAVAGDRYLWLNPVIGKMAGERYPELLAAVAARGYTVATCTEALPAVRQAYLNHLRLSPQRPLIDARCPRIAALVRERFDALADRIAPIQPILISCADILYHRHVAPAPSRATLTVVTPCTDLALYGKALFRNRIRFPTWRDFRRDEGLTQGFRKTDASPIPPGFFAFPGSRVLEASGPEASADLLQRCATGRLSPDVDLLELLYCRDGCHHGDGI